MVEEPDETSSQSRPMGVPQNPSEKKSSGKSQSTRDDQSEVPGVSGDPDAAYSHASDPHPNSGVERADAHETADHGDASSSVTTVGRTALEEPDHAAVEEDVHSGEMDEQHGHHHSYDHHGGGPPNSTEETEEGDDDDWSDEEEEGGGPVKSFLEHLEDLRWVIIRAVVSILIAMVVCLAAANKVVDLLKEPLENAQKIAGKTTGYVALVQIGPTSTNLHPIKLETNQFGAIPFGTNRAIKVQMEPVAIGTNLTMGLKVTPAREEEIPYEMLVSLKNMGPISPFVVALKIALFGGIGLASPFVLFFIGQFVVPALHQKERRYLYQALAIGSLLFCAGVAFCYFAMLQIALNAAMKFSRWMNFEPDIWRAEEYISFVVKFLLGMGLSFELPVVLLTLVKLELLDYERMKKFRPYWVVVNLVLAAMLTPPDVVSQLLMAVPLQVLYEISVLIAWYWHKRDQKRLREEEGVGV